MPQTKINVRCYAPLSSFRAKPLKIMKSSVFIQARTLGIIRHGY